MQIMRIFFCLLFFFLSCTLVETLQNIVFLLSQKKKFFVQKEIKVVVKIVSVVVHFTMQPELCYREVNLKVKFRNAAGDLSAANIDAASSWTQTRDDFINIVIFNYVRNNLNTKKTCQYCFQDGPVALILLNLLWNTLLQAQLFSPPCWSILKNHSLQLKKVHVLHQKCPYTNKGSEWIWKALSKSTCTLQ